MESIVKLRSLAPIAASLAFLAGCAATIGQDGLEKSTAQAIGRSLGQFTIYERSEETGGRINYTVSTRDGANYSCYLYGATGFQKVMSFGQTPNSDAICTRISSGKSKGVKQGPSAPGQSGRGTGGECNALQRSTDRC